MCFAFVVTTSEYVQLCKLASRRCALDIRLCYCSFGPRKGGHWKIELGGPGVGLGRLRLGLPGAAAMGPANTPGISSARSQDSIHTNVQLWQKCPM